MISLWNFYSVIPRLLLISCHSQIAEFIYKSFMWDERLFLCFTARKLRALTISHFKLDFFIGQWTSLQEKQKNIVRFITRLCSTLFFKKRLFVLSLTENASSAYKSSTDYSNHFQRRFACVKVNFLRYLMIQNIFFRKCSTRESCTVKLQSTSSRLTLKSFQDTQNHWCMAIRSS